jgi:hypothetical protein
MVPADADEGVFIHSRALSSNLAMNWKRKTAGRFIMPAVRIDLIGSSGHLKSKAFELRWLDG